MARPVRLDAEDTWHHVMNRGAGRQQVFFTRSDGEWFEHLLGLGNERYGVEVHAYCLMRNHYHLLLRCPNGLLARFMQHVGSAYTRFVNTHLERDGPIFRARYRSVVVRSEVQLARTGRYIHRNPIDVDPPVDLEHYRWSSLRWYTAAEAPPSWLHTEVLLAMFTDVSTYASYIDGPMRLDAKPDPESLRTTIDWLVDERPELGRAATRAIAFGVHDRGSPALRHAIAPLLTFPSDEAFRAAASRARKQFAACPELWRLVDRAIDLAA